MIDKNVVTKAVDEWLQKGDYYLVDVEMTPDDRIVIEIDHADGVWIEDCADLSRHLQETLGEELGDYELEVGSAGIGQPFKVAQQYRNHKEARHTERSQRGRTTVYHHNQGEATGRGQEAPRHDGCRQDIRHQ